MGATKRIHPVSLHVIRGAAEYCGWKFGKIKQVKYYDGLNKAEYTCEIEEMPGTAHNWPIKVIHKQLQHCFMDDISVASVWIKPGGQFMARLFVQLNPHGEASTTEHLDGENMSLESI